MHIFLFALLSLLSGSYTASSNFSADLYGPVDTRVNTWGHADAIAWNVTFKPPAGHRVRVLRIRGDLVAWARVLPGDPPVRPGQYAGVLLGFQTTAPEGSVRCDWCADNTPLYIQAAIDAAPTRAAYDYSDLDVLLEADNKLVVKVASWLNTTGYPIHLEPTFTVTYRFERIP